MRLSQLMRLPAKMKGSAPGPELRDDRPYTVQAIGSKMSETKRAGYSVTVGG